MASFACPESGLFCRVRGRVKSRVFPERGARRADWPAVDCGRLHRDQRLAVKPYVTRRERLVKFGGHERQDVGCMLIGSRHPPAVHLHQAMIPGMGTIHARGESSLLSEERAPERNVGPAERASRRLIELVRPELLQLRRHPRSMLRSRQRYRMRIRNARNVRQAVGRWAPSRASKRSLISIPPV